MRYFNNLILIGLIFPLCAFAQLEGVDYDWQEKRTKNGISIFTSIVEGSPFKAVRGTMTVNASVTSLVALVEDMEACPEWAELCKESRIEERVSAFEAFAYIYNDLPFPVSDRDVYVNVVWTKNPETQTVTMTSNAVVGGPPKTKAVRIKHAVSQWHFTPLGGGHTRVESFGHIDPNGPTPAWVINMMIVDTPYKTMVNMRNVVESGKYADTVIPFLGDL